MTATHTTSGDVCHVPTNPRGTEDMTGGLVGENANGDVRVRMDGITHTHTNGLASLCT